MTVLAVLAAAIAGWLTLRPPAQLRLRKRRADHRRVVPGDLLWWGLVPLGGLSGMLAWGLEGLSIGLAGGLVLATVAVVLRHHRRRRRIELAAAEVFAACELLAGLIRVGHVPAAALRIAAKDSPCLNEVVAAQRIGGEVGPALRRAGAGAGREGLAELGVAWEVAEQTGASLPATVDSLAERLAARRKVAAVVATELAAPRATGRLLAMLPVAGLLLGYSFGGDPVAFLTGSVIGQLSLVLGIGLGCAGVLWTERLAESASA